MTEAFKKGYDDFNKLIDINPYDFFHDMNNHIEWDNGHQKSYHDECDNTLNNQEIEYFQRN